MKLAIHLHLYYCNMWDEDIKQYLKNIKNCDYDLYVTIIEKNEKVINDIKIFNSEAKIIFLPENRGYDIAPFIYFLHNINLNDYDLILKIHTKNKYFNKISKLDKCHVSNEEWFYLLMNNLLGSEDIFKKNIEIFDKNKNIGLLSAKYLINKIPKKYKKRYTNDILIDKLKYNLISKKSEFVAGTMFFVRTYLMAKIKENFNFYDFDISGKSGEDETLAHIMERIFGLVITEENYKIKGVNYDPFFKIKNFIKYRLKKI